MNIALSDHCRSNQFEDKTTSCKSEMQRGMYRAGHQAGP